MRKRLAHWLRRIADRLDHVCHVEFESVKLEVPTYQEPTGVVDSVAYFEQPMADGFEMRDDEASGGWGNYL